MPLANDLRATFELSRSTDSDAATGGPGASARIPLHLRGVVECPVCHCRWVWDDVELCARCYTPVAAPAGTGTGPVAASTLRDRVRGSTLRNRGSRTPSRRRRGPVVKPLTRKTHRLVVSASLWTPGPALRS